jgi:hypothetical protein
MSKSATCNFFLYMYVLLLLCEKCAFQFQKYLCNTVRVQNISLRSARVRTVHYKISFELHFMCVHTAVGTYCSCMWYTNIMKIGT